MEQPAIQGETHQAMKTDFSSPLQLPTIFAERDCKVYVYSGLQASVLSWFFGDDRKGCGDRHPEGSGFPTHFVLLCVRLGDFYQLSITEEKNDLPRTVGASDLTVVDS